MLYEDKILLRIVNKLEKKLIFTRYCKKKRCVYLLKFTYFIKNNYEPVIYQPILIPITNG